MIDSHCHLDSEKFADDLDAILERAAAAGVTQMLSIGAAELDGAVKVAHRYRQVVASVGVHPHDAAKVTAQTYDELRALAKDPRVVAFGEIGLDFHYDFSPREVQREVFIEQLRIAAEADLPIVIHTREAWEETLAILRERWKGETILHCFTGNTGQAKEALELGCFIAFGGVLTFRTAEEVREAARIVPDEKLLIETDAPYLAPIPWRGKRNEPAFIAKTAEKLAEVRGTTVGQIAALTAANFTRLCSRSRYTDVSDGN